MTQQKNTLRLSKSIAGAALAGLGSFIVFENLLAAICALRHLLDLNGLEGPGMLLAIVFAVARLIQCYGADHEHFLATLLQHLLGSFWPLLLVRFGSILSRKS